jgi:purine-binding chemotaxis protein CheW
MQDQFKKILSRSTSASAIHYVVIGVGTETFGVPASQIQEIVGVGDMDPVPRLPKNLTGPLRLAGKMVFLLKLQASFARSQSDSEISARTCVVLLRAHSAISPKVPKGVVVDGIERIIAIDERDIETVSTRRKGLWSTCTLGFVRRHLPIILLDLEKLVSPEATDTGTTLLPNAETATSRLRRKREESRTGAS